MYINPQQMKHRIDLLQPGAELADTDDAIGGRPDAYTTAATVWCKLEAISTQARYQAKVATMQVVQSATIRHRTDVGAGWLVEYNSKRYEVAEAHDPDNRGHYLQLLLREVMP